MPLDETLDRAVVRLISAVRRRSFETFPVNINDRGAADHDFRRVRPYAQGDDSASNGRMLTFADAESMTSPPNQNAGYFAWSFEDAVGF